MQDQKRANLLHWPSPLSSDAYALEDYPRFFTPAWGVQPMPASATKNKATNGYDFGNNVEHDTYVFLLGEKVGDWHASRAEFVKLAGIFNTDPSSLLPIHSFK